jgi:hypothetical protein
MFDDDAAVRSFAGDFAGAVIAPGEAQYQAARRVWTRW